VEAIIVANQYLLLAVRRSPLTLIFYFFSFCFQPLLSIAEVSPAQAFKPLEFSSSQLPLSCTPQCQTDY
jgi:hypothetical protein